MSETNLIGTEWRNKDNKHIYVVLDQTNLDRGTPHIKGDSLLFMKGRGDATQYITITTRILENEFIEHHKVRVGTPGVDPLNKGGDNT